MSRHLRHHWVRQSEYWVPRFKASADPLQLAQLLRTNPNALLAFAEKLWVDRMEPQACARRWPYRDPWRAKGDPFHGQLAPSGIVPSADTLSAAPYPLNAAARHWIEYHAAGFTMMALWRAALCQAACVAHSGMAGWQISPPDTSFMSDWSVVAEQDRSLRFLGLSAEGLCFSKKTLPDKRARCHAFENAQADLWHALLDVCCGSCLTWTQRDG